MHQFEELINSNSAQSSLASGSSSQHLNPHPSRFTRLHSSIFGVQSIIANPFSELEYYLDPVCTPIGYGKPSDVQTSCSLMFRHHAA